MNSIYEIFQFPFSLMHINSMYENIFYKMITMKTFSLLFHVKFYINITLTLKTNFIASILITIYLQLDLFNISFYLLLFVMENIIS